MIDPKAIEDRQRAIGNAVTQIERQFGKGSIMRMGDEEPRKVASISTGALALDLALGIGGVPRGRVIEIFGPESSGKTTLALHIIAEAQKAGGLTAFIDAEHALDPTYAEAIGVDLENLYFSQPGNDTVGNQTKVKVVKNKVAPPFKVVEFDIMYGEGISKEGSLLDIGLANEVVQKSGAWFAYGDERLGQGRENAKQFLKDNDEVRERILHDIYEKLLA